MKKLLLLALFVGLVMLLIGCIAVDDSDDTDRSDGSEFKIYNTAPVSSK